MYQYFHKSNLYNKSDTYMLYKYITNNTKNLKATKEDLLKLN